MTLAPAVEGSTARRSGAKAVLLTVLGEFVLPAGGEVWTATLVEAADRLDIGEKNARQAISRIRDEGLIEPHRHGRSVRWALTPAGRELLETGARRIYGFGSVAEDWAGDWLVTHCPVAESQRSLRTQLRTQLGFLGFGELSASLFVSPHVEREPELRRVHDELDLSPSSMVLRSRTSTEEEDVEMVRRAWDLDGLVASYEAFRRRHGEREADGGEACFRAVVELVHDWRRFPFVDPELPAALLPSGWVGACAAELFGERHAAWSGRARSWFEQLDAAGATT